MPNATVPLSVPILSDAIADRLERALAEAAAARLAGVRDLPGNPVQVESRQFGPIDAALVGRDVAHYPYFSGPRELRAGDEAHVPELVDWYRERRRPFYARLAPVFASVPLLRSLAAAGMHQTDFMSTLYGPPTSADADPRVTIDQDTDVFVELWTRDAPEHERSFRQDLVRAEFGHGWRCYVARIEDQPAAYGALFVARGAVAVCAAGATVPALRRLGCQTALLGRRMADAAAAGCDLVVVQASPGSTSERNLRRVGLALAYTCAVWTF